ncbi:sensor histidine kinase [Umezakia ovalisporum]|uniref:histidine kinase n=1 Tax=Umezakia ovalisporum FSS-43 TaxID=2740520 RepID=A0ABT6K899_9CYAN|nr:PAS domain-containing sensor histidine kinase [Umezakia ovalisporum]MDH6058647.1 PAS domain-containing sensor histidine kinase [Umezakia ovalisporum FSS-43]MDH6070457.1 PAS domain-containing sensor histidine kinase [Umezakia ovalisporum CobakiLakeA]MDH6073970.1 PAS domain-containing sensor histidine kinase [Umezakia ovalisporum CS-1034]MDH6080711.1 PAS domain-containing sensor histidine kinase [Umezakia ovalisporum FSS-44]MDH6094818.1 PAS domain-containing sensor histidine kinase [Umezakia 
MYKWTEEVKNSEEHLQWQVAELKKKEAQIQQSLCLFRSTLESAAHGIVAVSLQGDILGFNQKFVDMWQIPSSLILSKNYVQCQGFLQDQLKYPEAYCQIMQELSSQSDLEKFDILELKDGRVFAQYSQPQWLGGKIIGRVWSSWDVTEYQRREELPKFNKASFWSLAESTNVSIFVIEGWNLSYMNPAAEVLTGYTKEELLTGFDPRQLFKNKRCKQLQNKDLEYQEIKILEKDGKERWLACAILMLDEQKIPVQIIAGIDITDYKQGESELNQTLEKMKDIRELKADFMSMVCHQFRTPLNVISFSNSLLKRYINKCQDEQTKPLLDHIQSAVEQITKMLDDILFFAKAEAAKLNFDAKQLNLVEFCNNLIAEIQASGRGNSINFVSQGSYIKVFMDQNLLDPMIRNLLDNAMKYSPIGSVVDFKLFCECGKVVFQVTDRGIGIPIDDRERLFEPFYRGSNIHNVPGTGLGLSIVKTLVDLHKGHIAVESEVGVSTTFTIMLPAVKSKL